MPNQEAWAHVTNAVTARGVHKKYWAETRRVVWDRRQAIITTGDLTMPDDDDEKLPVYLPAAPGQIAYAIRHAANTNSSVGRCRLSRGQSR